MAQGYTSGASILVGTPTFDGAVKPNADMITSTIIVNTNETFIVPVGKFWIIIGIGSFTMSAAASYATLNGASIYLMHNDTAETAKFINTNLRLPAGDTIKLTSTNVNNPIWFSYYEYDI